MVGGGGGQRFAASKKKSNCGSPGEGGGPQVLKNSFKPFANRRFIVIPQKAAVEPTDLKQNSIPSKPLVGKAVETLAKE